MFFFNDECDCIDDNEYDWFTQVTEVERRCAPCHRRNAAANQHPASRPGFIQHPDSSPQNHIDLMSSR
jgi:hypothetical protein